MTKAPQSTSQSHADRKDGTSVVRVARPSNAPATVVARPAGGGVKAHEPPCARCRQARARHEDDEPFGSAECAGYVPGLPAPVDLRRSAMQRATVVARRPTPNPVAVPGPAEPPWDSAGDEPARAVPRKAVPKAAPPVRSGAVDAIVAGPPRGGIRSPPPSQSRMVDDEPSPELCGAPADADSELVSSLGGGEEPPALTTEQRTRLQVKAEEADGRGTGKTSEALFAALARLDWLEAQLGPAKRGRPASLPDEVVKVARRAIAKGQPFEGLAAKLGGVDELALRRAITGLTFRGMKDPPAVVIPSARSALQTAKAPGKHRALVPAEAPPASPAPRKVR